MDHALDPSLPMSAPPRQNMQGGSNVTPLATRTNALEGRSSPIVVSSQPQSTETEQYPPPMAFVPLKMTKMHAYVECHVTTAFVTLECSCYAPTHYQPSDCVLSLPLHGEGTITDVEVFNGNRVYTTTVVPNTELGGMSAAKGGEAGQYQKADPENFILTFPNVRPGDMLALRVTWMQPLLFSEGKYKFSMPLKFPPDFLDDPSRPINSYLSISCEVNTGSPEPVKWGGTQHPIKVLSEIDGQVKLEADASAAWPNGDFEIEYSVWGGAISAACNVQPAAKGAEDPRGTFCLSVSPPAPDNSAGFARSVVFLVDRSGSMGGQPMEDAKRAVIRGIQMLQQIDTFSVIAFDNEQFMWSPALQHAGEKEVASAIEWVGAITARSTTDILTPLTLAFNTISDYHNSCPVGERGVPYIFLITDGAVQNEREICRKVQELHADAGAQGYLVPRVSTFGIGSFCNHFFLSQLATSGRGLADTAMRGDRILEKMERLLVAAARPVLTQVQVGVEEVSDVEIYPFPVPDLFSGAPLVVSGKFKGDFPQQITLRGTLPGGGTWDQQVHVTAAANIPLDKVFVKQRLDLMTAQAWLTEDLKMERQIVDLSVREGVPCAHTSVVGFETTRQNYSKVKSSKAAGKKVSVGALALGGLGAVTVLAGLGALASFGDVGATLSNLSVGSALDGVGDLFGGVGDLVGDGAEGLCACCGEIGGALGDCGEGIGEACGGAFSFCGECFSGIGDGLQECGDGLQQCFSCFAELAGELGECCGVVCGCLGELVG